MSYRKLTLAVAIGLVVGPAGHASDHRDRQASKPKPKKVAGSKGGEVVTVIPRPHAGFTDAERKKLDAAMKRFGVSVFEKEREVTTVGNISHQYAMTPEEISKTRQTLSVADNTEKQWETCTIASFVSTGLSDQERAKLAAGIGLKTSDRSPATDKEVEIQTIGVVADRYELTPKEREKLTSSNLFFQLDSVRKEPEISTIESNAYKGMTEYEREKLIATKRRPEDRSITVNRDKMREVTTITSGTTVGMTPDEREKLREVLGALSPALSGMEGSEKQSECSTVGSVESNYKLTAEEQNKLQTTRELRRKAREKIEAQNGRDQKD